MFKKVFLFTVLYYSIFELSAVMIALSTEELTRESDIVIQGTVEAIESLYSEDKSIIVSRAEVQVDKVIRGFYKDSAILVEFVGGEVEGIGMGRSDTPHLHVNENLILFLKKSKSLVGGNTTVFHIIGQAQGKYTITKNQIAIKTGFEAIFLDESKNPIDNDIPLKKLISKIKSVKIKSTERLNLTDQLSS